MHWKSIGTTQMDFPVWAVFIPLVLLSLLILANPVPLVGGYTDDFRYLVGAQCLDCVPTNHWERRFAIVWPTGVAIRLFGQNLWSVMAFPVAAAFASVVLTYKLVDRQYGPKAALVAACVLSLTPVFAERSMRVGIEMIELAFLLGSVFVLQRRKGHFWAGALLAMAVLCRPSQLSALPMVAFLAWWLEPRSLKWFVIGFCAPLVAEALVYLITVGDPLYPWKLSLQHMQFWKLSMDDARLGEFLSAEVDTTKSPLFNPEFIGGWVPAAKIEAHWTIQGIINLLASAECGFTLCAAIALSLLAWKQLDRLQLALIASAALYFGALTYAFGIDPRPRMFLPIVVIAAVLIGSFVRTKWPWPRTMVPATLLALILVVGAVQVTGRIDYRPDAQKADRLLAHGPYMLTTNARQRLALIRRDFPAGGSDLIEIDDKCPSRLAGRWLTHRDRHLCIYAGPSYFVRHERTQLILSPVAEWIAAHPGKVEIDPSTRRQLDFLEEARRLPDLDSASEYLLYKSAITCESWLASNGWRNGSLSVAAEALIYRTAFLPAWTGSLCLFRYERPVQQSEVLAAIVRAPSDRPSYLRQIQRPVFWWS